MTLDKKDRRILLLLDQDARLPYSSIAKKVGLSKQVVKYRVEKLENERYIRGYYPLVDWSCLGLISFRVYLKIKEANYDAIIAHLKKEKRLFGLATLTNKWDIVVGIVVPHIVDFYNFWDPFLKKYASSIKAYTTAVYSPIYHYPRVYVCPEEKTKQVQWVIGKRKKEQFDQKDVAILIALAKNARMPLLHIAKEVDLSAQAIRLRLNNLKKKGILLACRALVNLHQLGYEYYKVELSLAQYDKMKAIMSYCYQHPNITQVNRTIGSTTFEVEFHTKDLEHMRSILKEMQQFFPQVIESYTYLRLLDEIRMVYMPKLTLT